VAWARTAAAGEDISIIEALVAPPPGVREPITAAAFGQLADQLVTILAGSGPATGAPAPAGEMSDAEADELWPPRTAAEAEARHARIEAAAGRVIDYTDDEIFAMLFGEDES
jgi:hypothetical protein